MWNEHVQLKSNAFGAVHKQTIVKLYVILTVSINSSLKQVPCHLNHMYIVYISSRCNFGIFLHNNLHMACLLFVVRFFS